MYAYIHPNVLYSILDKYKMMVPYIVFKLPCCYLSFSPPTHFSNKSRVPALPILPSHHMCPVDFLCRTPPTWSPVIFLVSMVTPNYIFIPEYFELGALDERENPIFVFLGPGFLTQHNII